MVGASTHLIDNNSYIKCHPGEQSRQMVCTTLHEAAQTHDSKGRLEGGRRYNLCSRSGAPRHVGGDSTGTGCSGYPHDTWVLDEGDEAPVKALCYALGAQHFSRKNFSHYHTAQGTFQSHSKYGNYNAWLAEVGFKRYDIITAFDPDHVPKPSFLAHVLGYFEDPQVGYVQVAPAYYNQKTSFIARGAAEETYAFYSTMQMASYGLGDRRPMG